MLTALARLPLAIASLPFVLFLCFSSLLGVLSSIHAHMGRVRQIKRNRAIITFLSAFP